MSSEQKLDLPLSETEQLSRQVRRAEALLALPHLGEQCEEEGDFLQQALEVLENLTDSQISFIHFVNDDEQSIELITWSRRTLEYYCNAVYDKHYPVAEAGIWADALRQRKPVVFNDYVSYQPKRGLPSGHAHLNRLISLPVINQGKVVMLTGVGNKALDYTENDVETVQLLSNEIWNIAKRRRVLLALENLNQELEQRVEQRTAALQEREIRYRSLMDRASDAIILTNSQGYFLETNFQAEKLLGYSKEELQGMHLSQIYASEALPIVQRKFNKLTEQAFLSGFNVDFLTKKGELIPVDISASVIEIQGERIIQSIA
ncbi:MAG: GAF domain-containing protein, partial [Microcystaceae cyanobacterium]